MSVNKGFTLLELLISIALMAILMAGITGLGSRFVGNIHLNQTKQQEIEDIYSAFHLINQDTISYYSDFVGGLNEVSMLTLQKALVAGAQKSGQTQVAYRVVTENKKFTLYRKVKDKFMRNNGIETKIIQASEIIFTFIGENLEEYPAWSLPTPPVALRVKIIDSKGREWQRTIPFMVRFNDL